MRETLERAGLDPDFYRKYFTSEVSKKYWKHINNALKKFNFTKSKDKL